MLLTLAILALILWLIGIIAGIAGGFVHLLLLVGIILLIAHFLGGRGTRTNV